VAFVPKGAKPDGTKQKWIEGMGTYYYYSLILAGFDPAKADAIHDRPAHEIAEAYVSMMCYNHKPE
jgi:hypothetical protein